MIARCLECGSPIFRNHCSCGRTVVRCPDCGGDGRQKSIELLTDAEGFMGYILKPIAKPCETCGGFGKTSVQYLLLD